MTYALDYNIIAWQSHLLIFLEGFIKNSIIFLGGGGHSNFIDTYIYTCLTKEREGKIKK